MHERLVAPAAGRCWRPLGLLLGLLLGASAAWAQKTSATAPLADTSRVFSVQSLADLVLANHPIVRQAALLGDEARSQVLQARGGFDPRLSSDFRRKQFGGSEYYNNWGNELKVPLWLAGIDLKASYDRYVGPYADPESGTPLAGLAGVGLTVPLGQGLLLDARRSTLRQARVLVAAAEADRVKQVNEVWLQAAKDYWTWYYTSRQATLLDEGVALADRRYRATARRVRLGDQAAIDSVEAQLTVQDRRVQAEQLRAELNNARLVLSNHLWTSDGRPAELPAYAVPQAPSLDSVGREVLSQLADFAAAQHPALRKLDAKISQLGIEERYRRELLKPRLNVSGTLLSQGNFYRAEVPASYNFSPGNYKVGVEAAFPLLMRAERGKLQYTRIQVREVGLERQQSQRVIVTQVNTVYNTLRATGRQLVLQGRAIAGQQQLLQAELQRFDLGESTIFLVNARETKLIELRIKQESLRASYEKARAELSYYAGTGPVGLVRQAP